MYNHTNKLIAIGVFIVKDAHSKNNYRDLS